MTDRSTESTNGRPSGRPLSLRRFSDHDPILCHKCMRGKLTHDLTDDERRELAIDLWRQGFSIDYLAHKYGLTPRTEERTA
ncbi:hypothetical protein ACFVWR_15390 [Leifsonia sp. NPDC058292]|uniref:hypothetical protein n=1 Tax=Leifsonia sp. NPDC058292 TaxID=3346428 RepID=UPI0036D7A001